jgi:hypothetical protein
MMVRTRPRGESMSAATISLIKREQEAVPVTVWRNRLPVQQERLRWERGGVCLTERGRGKTGVRLPQSTQS